MLSSSSRLWPAWLVMPRRVPAGPRPQVSLLPQAGVLQIGQHVVWWVTVPGSVLSGVLVVVVLAAARHLWHRGRVPTALSRRVWRPNYLWTVYKASRRPDIRRLDVLAPRLVPANGSKVTIRLQEGWEQIQKRGGRVRVLTLDSLECLRAGVELLERGIEVRVVHRGLGSEDLTCHLFGTAKPAEAQAIINQHQRGADKPIRVRGAEAIRPYRNDFDREWEKARPLESVLAEMILPWPCPYGTRTDIVSRRFQDASTSLGLQARVTSLILPHFAFRACSKVVFIVGQPGSGKSYVRRRLYDRLRSMHIECYSVTDYPYAYRDMLRTLLQMNPPVENGYDAYPGGAFVAHDENALLPALRALAGDVRDAVQKYEVTLVEFARSELVAALGEFEAIRWRAQVIHVSAPPELRQARIDKRARPPELTVEDAGIKLELSDDHLLPSLAERKLYATDGIDALRTSSKWRGRVFEINNGFDEVSLIDQELGRFVERVTAPYRQAAQWLSRPRCGAVVRPPRGRNRVHLRQGSCLR